MASFPPGFPVFRLLATFVGLMTVAIAYIVFTLATNISWLGAANGLVAIPPPRVLGACSWSVTRRSCGWAWSCW